MAVETAQRDPNRVTVAQGVTDDASKDNRSLKVDPVTDRLKTNTTVTGDVNTTETNYALQVDDTSTANVTYLGKAAIGAATSAASWQIKRIDESSGVAITWANGDDSFDNVWDDRTGLSYS